MDLLQSLKSLVNERLSAAAEEIFGIVERIITEYEDKAYHYRQENDHQRRLLDMVLKPHIKLHRADPLYLPEFEEVSPEQQERNSRLIQEEPEPPQVKEEQEELLQRPEEANVSTLTLIAVKSEETEPVASTSTEHMESQAGVEDHGASQPSCDVHLPYSHCSESDTEDSDEWEESSKAHPDLEALTTQNVKGQTSLSNTPNLKSSKQTSSTGGHIGENRFKCTDCRKYFKTKGSLKRHMNIHTGEKRFSCTVCGKVFRQINHQTTHMRTHTGEKPFSCTVCGKSFCQNIDQKRHMRTHTGEKPFSCMICGKCFTVNYVLQRHMRIHTGHNSIS